MGKMHDALRKAEEERERKRLEDSDSSPSPSSDGGDDGGAPATMGVAAAVNKGGSAGLSTVDESILVLHDPNDPRVEQFRAIRTNLKAMDDPPRVFGVTSSLNGEGKVVAATNLAAVLAEEENCRVLLVDCDLRREDSQDLLGLPSSPGFSNILKGEADPLEVAISTPIEDVQYIGCGDPVDNPGSLVGSSLLKSAVDAWRLRYDRVIMITPHVVGVNDTSIIGPLLDGVVMAIRMGATPRRFSERTLEALTGAGVRVLGCILTSSDTDVSSPVVDG